MNSRQNQIRVYPCSSPYLGSPGTLISDRETRNKKRETGYALLTFLLLITLLMIGLLYQAPQLAQQIRRDREEEMVRRANQYVVAVKRYYRKFGRYPTRIEELENTNNIRFLRAKYKDPMVEDGEWEIIRFGGVRNPRRAPGQQGQVGTPAGQAGLSGGAGGTQPSSIGTSVTDIAQQQGGQQLGQGSQLGGGAIVGVRSKSKKEGVKEINEKTHYNEWDFYYDPALDTGLQQQQPPGGGPQRPPRGGTPGPGTGPSPQPPGSTPLGPRN